MPKTLSKRQFEITELIARGYSVKEVATKLFLAPYTIQTHVQNIKNKIGARNFADLTRKFILSLDNPKQYFKTLIAIFFLSIQTFISLGNTDANLRRPSKTRIVNIRAARKSMLWAS